MNMLTSLDSYDSVFMAFQELYSDVENLVENSDEVALGERDDLLELLDSMCDVTDNISNKLCGLRDQLEG